MCYQYNTAEINEYLNEAGIPEIETEEIEVPNMDEYIRTCADGVTLIEEGEML